MSANVSELGLKLVTLVAPNWPVLQETDISVLDLKSCVLRGTPEQLETAREVRAIMESIWGLQDGAPERKLLDALWDSTATRMDYGGAAGEAGSAAARRGEDLVQTQLPRLPNELVHRVLHFLILDPWKTAAENESDGPSDAQLVSFGLLRRVSQAFKNHAETEFIDVLHRYVARIVRKLLHVLYRGNNAVAVLRAARESSAILSQAKELRVIFWGDEVASLNAVLQVFAGLQQLYLYLPSKAATLYTVDLRPCCQLRMLCIAGLDLEDRSQDPVGFRRRILDDIHGERPPLGPSSALSRDPHKFPRCPRRRIRLEVGTSPFDFADLLASLRVVVRHFSSHVDVSGTGLSAKDITDMGLDAPRGPKAAGLRECELGDEEVSALALGRNKLLEGLDMAENRITDPETLSLPDGHLVVLDLSRNPLSSATFGLARNTTLRYFDLSESLRHVEGGIVLALDQLGNQLLHNTTLSILLLDTNDITDEAIRGLRLPENVGLLHLSLRNNKLSNDGLREALQGNTMLELVDARGNPLVTEAYAKQLEIESASERESTPRKIVVGEVDDSSDEAELVKEPGGILVPALRRLLRVLRHVNVML